MRNRNRLTAREAQILAMLGEGDSTETIAHGLFITPNTVRNHITKILEKTGTHTRLGAVAAAKREHVDRGAMVLAWCLNQGWRLTALQKMLVVQAFLVTEAGCDGSAHEWAPRQSDKPWTCMCGQMTVGDGAND